ncbi:MAG: hypothetical protein HYZ13_12985 [Acidobacteria bacterium]|nr:hypothetical protein [Acidobacteriota bacterium]
MIHDAEKLLGGYATGTLTEAERRELFAAALEHQVLFDALADEEALRELLADPAARAELLAALAEAPAPKVLPFWRRHPGALGLAASLLIAVTAGLAYLRSPQLPPQPRPAPAPPTALEASPQPDPSVPRRDAEAPPKPEPRRRQAPLGYSLPPTEAAGRPPANLPEAPAAAAKPMPATPPPPPPPALDKGNADTFADAARAEQAFSKEEAKARQLERKAIQAVPSEAAASGLAATTPALQERIAAAPEARGGALAPKAAAAPAPTGDAAPTWALETAQDGSLQLSVRHLPGTHAILLRRTPGGAVLVSSLPDSSRFQGRRITTFPLPADPGPMDLYILAALPLEPLKLPAEGPIGGFRARIRAPRP